jgi:hypothetical protein
MGQLRENLVQNRDVSTSGVVLAATDLSAGNLRTVIAGKAQHTIYLCKIAAMVTTDNAAVQTFQDDAATPIVAAKTKVSPGVGPLLFDFGPNGFALTEGQGLSLTNSAAGLAFAYAITAYMKKTSPKVP